MKIMFFLFTTFYMFLFFYSAKSHVQDITKGVNIDIARKEYSLESLKAIVKQVHLCNGDYVQLHFSDDEKYAIESKFFSYSEDDLDSYLSKKEVRELIKYSNELNIMIIPDIDFPSHSKGLLTLLKIEDADLYQSVVSDYSDNTLEFYSNKKAIEVSKRQLNEILILFHQPKFQNQQKIVLGGDEVPGAGIHQEDFINFMNILGRYVESKGYEPQIWNDMIMYSGLKLLDSKFSILYWRQNESQNDGPKVEDFSNENFKLYNYNQYSLYFLPSKKYDKIFIQKQCDYIKEFYSYNKFFYLTNPYKKVDSENIKGSMLSFWGENTSDMNQEEILEQEIPLIKAYFENK